ncbi:MAG: PEP-CTERM sorting domain-containing protein [Proteobacteria bacterium]|nr:PEP-CTERM sorting domain-containing protein [Pseudomonadota bacterium]
MFDPGGAGSFSVAGIDISEMLDPNDPLAFPTLVSFVMGGTVMFSQIANTVDTPEPATLGLAAAGVGVVAAARGPSASAEETRRLTRPKASRNGYP